MITQIFPPQTGKILTTSITANETETMREIACIFLKKVKQRDNYSLKVCLSQKRTIQPTILYVKAAKGPR